MTKHISHAFAGYYVHQIYGFSDTKSDHINITSQQCSGLMNLKSTPPQHTYLVPSSSVTAPHGRTHQCVCTALSASRSESPRALTLRLPSGALPFSRVHVQNCTRLSSSSSWSVSRACNRLLAFGAKHLAAQPRTVRPPVRQSLLTSVSFSSPVVHLASKNKPRRCLTHSQFLEYTRAHRKFLLCVTCCNFQFAFGFSRGGPTNTIRPLPSVASFPVVRNLSLIHVT